MACYERREMVEEIVKKLEGLDVKVFYDDRPKGERKGTYYTQLKCINDALEGDYTHLVLLQDDILLVNDFDKCIKELIKYKPFDLWTLYCPRIKHVNSQHPYGQIYPANTWGPGNIIEIELLKDIMKFREDRLPQCIYDDCIYWMYCWEKRLPVYTTQVALLQHLGNGKSLLGHGRKDQVSKVWIGEDIYDVVNWNSRECKKLPYSASKSILENIYERYGRN